MIGRETEFGLDGVRRRGVVALYQEIGPGRVRTWGRTGDGALHRTDGAPPRISDPLRVARDVLAGRRIPGLGPAEQLTMLAAAVVEAAETGARRRTGGGGP